MNRSSVRFLVSSAGTRSTVLLGLAASRISNQERPVVLEQQLLDLAFLRLVDVLLIVSDKSLGESLTDGIDLGNMTTAAHSDSDVQIGESLEAKEEDGFKDLDPEGLGFQEFDGGAIDSEYSLALLYDGVGH